MTLESSSAREFARQLIDRPDAAGRDLKNIPGAQVATQCVWDELARWTGDDGCHALVARAIIVAQSRHPELPASSAMVPRSRDWLEGIGTGAGTNGSGPSAATVEEILTALIELLVRLIGEPIAMRLLQPCLSESARDASRTSGGERGLA